MGQLAKQMIERPIGSYGANTEMNPKEECKVIFTRRESVEKEKKLDEDVHDEEEEKKEEGEKNSYSRYKYHPQSTSPILFWCTMATKFESTTLCKLTKPPY